MVEMQFWAGYEMPKMPKFNVFSFDVSAKNDDGKTDADRSAGVFCAFVMHSGLILI